MGEEPADVVNRRNVLVRPAAGLFAATLSLTWLLALPASAENLSVTIDSPEEGQRFSDSNTVTVSGRVESALLTSVESVRAVVTRLYDDRVVADFSMCEPCGQDASISFSEPTPALAYNGPYSVRVVASGFLLVSGIRVNDASAERTFAMAVLPAAPRNLTAVKLADKKVKLSWSAVPDYPDLLGYLIYRGAPGAPLKPIKSVTPTETSYIDDQPAFAGGKFQYQVSAVRSGAVPGDDSELLQARSNLATVDVPAPAGPTTTGVSLPPGAPNAGAPGAGTPGASSLDVGKFFGSSGSQIQLPAPSGPASVQPPDTGFNPNLPFPSTSAGKKAQTQPGRPSALGAGSRQGAGSGLPDSNRRALLVPVAAGSVLCVAALHLRWLSRKLAVTPLGAGAAGDLEHADPGLEPDLSPLDAREPVGAGVGAGPPGG